MIPKALLNSRTDKGDTLHQLHFLLIRSCISFFKCSLCLHPWTFLFCFPQFFMSQINETAHISTNFGKAHGLSLHESFCQVTDYYFNSKIMRNRRQIGSLFSYCKRWPCAKPYLECLRENRLTSFHFTFLVNNLIRFTCFQLRKVPSRFLYILCYS